MHLSQRLHRTIVQQSCMKHCSLKFGSDDDVAFSSLLPSSAEAPVELRCTAVVDTVRFDTRKLITIHNQIITTIDAITFLSNLSAAIFLCLRCWAQKCAPPMNTNQI